MNAPADHQATPPPSPPDPVAALGNSLRRKYKARITGELVETAGLGQGQSISWLALFASTGTLICCALPILLVTLGAGATVAALTSSFPILITLSQYKLWIFLLSGSLLSIAAWLTWRPGRTCPTDPGLASLCQGGRKWNRRVLGTALAVWSVGFFSAFVLFPLVRWWDGL